MKIKHDATLWIINKSLSDLLTKKDEYENKDISKHMSIEDIENALDCVLFLRLISKNISPDILGDLVKPKDFYQLIKYMEIQNKKNEKIIKSTEKYDKKLQANVSQKLNKENKALNYYIKKLKSDRFIKTLPDEILSFKSKYGN